MRKLASISVALACAVLLQSPAALAAPSDIASGPAIWRVHSGDSTVYVFGSIHILPKGYPWITRRIADAMAASDLFVFEVPVGKDTIEKEREFIVKYGLLPRRQSIRGVLTQSEFDVYASVMQAAGLNARDFERYQPWLAAVVLGLAYLHPDSLTSLKGADDEVMSFAREHDRPTQYLETPQQQLELLTSGSEKSQIAGLRRLIDTLPSSRNLEQELRESWSSGDIDRLTAVLDAVFRKSPEAQDFLVSRRNRLWLSAISPLLQRHGTSMITVGAAHIGGSSGLIALICGGGHHVERMLDSGEDVDACPAANVP